MDTYPLVPLPTPGILIIGGHLKNAAGLIRILKPIFDLPENPWKGHAPGQPLCLSFPTQENILASEQLVYAFANAVENCGGGLAWAYCIDASGSRTILDFYWATPEKTYDVIIAKEVPHCPDYQGFCKFMNTPHIVETTHKTIELTR